MEKKKSNFKKKVLSAFFLGIMGRKDGVGVCVRVITAEKR